jgi:hypothetical protein
MVTKKETTAIVAANQAADANHTNETVTVANSGDRPKADANGDKALVSAVEDTGKPADISPATEVDPSGAPVQIVPDVDLSHPAVDADPRKGTTVAQNRIDFNDPNLSGGEAVAKMLRAQGVEIITDPSSK